MTHIHDLSSEVLLIVFEYVVYPCGYDSSRNNDNFHALADTCRHWLDVTAIMYRKELVGLGAFEDIDDRCRDRWLYYVWLYVVDRMAKLPETNGIVWESWKCRCGNWSATGEGRIGLEGLAE